MSVNSSNSSFVPLSYHCQDSRAAASIFTSLNILKIPLLIPLCTLVLFLGHQRWRQQRSFKTTSHSDIFTLHMAAMELITLVACVFSLCGTYIELPSMENIGFYISTINFPGEMLFHMLTCMERYLAVVHPITYLGLKQAGGVRIRNISIGCVWLLCFGWMTMAALIGSNFPTIIFFCLLVVSLFVVSFCSLSVLCVLIRPGPGDVGGDRERVDQSKQRAFHTVMAILGVLWLWFVMLLVCVSLDLSNLLSYNDGCVVFAFGFSFNVPSSLVLPVLYLHRAGKLLCCHCRKE